MISCLFQTKLMIYRLFLGSIINMSTNKTVEKYELPHYF